jgi:hypothetical protein
MITMKRRRKDVAAVGPRTKMKMMAETGAEAEKAGMETRRMGIAQSRMERIVAITREVNAADQRSQVSPTVGNHKVNPETHS